MTIVTRPTPAMDPGHPPTGDCGTCHTTSSFVVAGGAKPTNHIPTTAACTLCHTNPASYKPGVMNHTGIASGCTTCHAAGPTGTPFYGVTPKPQGSGHIPTTADCATCHTSTTAFGPGTLMVHTGISTGCATCHDTGKSFTGVTNLKTKPTNHVPTTAACETCHSATNFTTFAGTAMSHSGIASGCTTCHAACADRHTVRRRDAEAAGQRRYPDHRRLHDVPQVDDRVRSGDGDDAHRHHQRLRDLPRDGQELHRGDDRDAADADADPNHPSTGDCSGCHSSTTSFTTGVERRQAGESHSDDGGVHAVPHQPGLLQAGGDEPQRHHQRLHDLSRGERDGDAVLRGDAEAAGQRAHPDHLDCADLPQSTTAFGPERRWCTPASRTGCATCHDTGKSFTGVTNLKTKPIESRADHRGVRDLPLRLTNFTTFAGTAMQSHRHQPAAARPATRPARRERRSPG